MTPEQMFTGKNLEVAIDTVSLVKAQLKTVYWEGKPTTPKSEERRKYWSDYVEVYSKRLLEHIGIDPFVIAIVKQVIEMFGSLLPAPILALIKSLLEKIGIKL